MAVKYSIIIRTYNEEAKLNECLTSIFNQSIKDFEIIIVDSESTDKTLEIAKKFPVKIINIKKKDFSYGKALNLGCSEAKGRYLIFLSGHAISKDKFWLKNLTKGFKDKRIAAIHGKQLPLKDCEPLMKNQMQKGWKEKRIIRFKEPSFSNANAAIRADLWKKNKFCETLIGTEDQEWVHRIQKQGFASLYEPTAEVYHSHNENIPQFSHRIYREILGLSLFTNRFKVLIKQIGLSKYYFIMDLLLIIRKRLNIKWLFRSIIYNGIILFASIAAITRTFFPHNYGRFR